MIISHILLRNLELLISHSNIALFERLHYPIAIIIFITTFIFITTERIHRTIIALLGALVMVGLGIVDLQYSYSNYVDWETITLLIGMMTIVTIALESGIFNYLAVKAGKLTRGKPADLLISFAFVTGVGSAFLDNVTTVLLMVPITLSITKILHINPMPFFMVEIISSNVGGSATLIGDPPNIMIGSRNDYLSFTDFLVNLGPVALISGIIGILFIYLIYRKDLQSDKTWVENLMHIDERAYITDIVGARKAIIVLILTIIGFFFHSFIHISSGYIAITGATILLLITKNNENKLENALSKIEWTTIFLLIGLFIQVGGLIEVGVIDFIAKKMYSLVGTNLKMASSLTLWFSALMSGFSGNMPSTTVMIPVLQEYIDLLISSGVVLSPESAQITVLWWSLALGSCLGGVATLIGCPANIVVINMARKKGYNVSYFDYLKIGLPMMFIFVLISQLYILLRYFPL